MCYGCQFWGFGCFIGLQEISFRLVRLLVGTISLWSCFVFEGLFCCLMRFKGEAVQRLFYQRVWSFEIQEFFWFLGFLVFILFTYRNSRDLGRIWGYRRFRGKEGFLSIFRFYVGFFLQERRSWAAFSDILSGSFWFVVNFRVFKIIVQGSV